MGRVPQSVASMHQWQDMLNPFINNMHARLLIPEKFSCHGGKRSRVYQTVGNLPCKRRHLSTRSLWVIFRPGVIVTSTVLSPSRWQSIMTYRFIFCSLCGTRLRFIRDVERNSVGCPKCGTGMELLPKHMATRHGTDVALTLQHHFVRTPELLPAAMLTTLMAGGRSSLRQVLVGTGTVFTIALLLVKTAVFHT